MDDIIRVCYIFIIAEIYINVMNISSCNLEINYSKERFFMNLSNQEDLTKIKKFSFMFIVLFIVLGFYQSIIITSLSLYMKKDK